MDRMYLLLLLVLAVLVGCPYSALAAQRTGDRSSFQAPLLPAEEAWSVMLGAEPSAPGVLGDVHVIVPLASGQLVAIDRETGATGWSLEVESSWPPLFSTGVVYAAATGGLHAVRSADGMRLWTVPLDAEPIAPLVLSGDTLLVLVEPGELRAIRAADGRERWRQPVGAASGTASVAADAVNVCVARGSTLTCARTADGAISWMQELPGTLSPPALSGDRVFVGSTDNTFYAFGVATGRLAWKARSGGDVVGATGDDDHDLIYVASLDQLLRALRPGSGNQVWKRELMTRTVAPPMAFGGIVLVSGNDPAASAFDARTGTPIATYAAPGDLQGVPLVDPVLVPFRVGMVIVTGDGRAIGLRPTAMMFRDPALEPLQALPGRGLTREPLSVPAPPPAGLQSR